MAYRNTAWLMMPIALALVGCSGPEDPAMAKREGLIADAQVAVAATLKDPDSAKFRKLRANPAINLVCGEVNGKNSYGAYSGYAPFFYFDGSIDISAPDGEPSIGYNAYCKSAHAAVAER